jgi:hypothetical protein
MASRQVRIISVYMFTRYDFSGRFSVLLNVNEENCQLIMSSDNVFFRHN